MLQYLQGKVFRRGVFVAAVRMPRELVHSFRTCLRTTSLDITLAWTDVPKPAPGRAMRDRQPVAVMVMQTEEKLLEVLAVLICKAQADLEYAAPPKLLRYVTNMAGLGGIM